VRDGGQISVGDSVLTPQAAPAHPVAYPLINGAERRLICRGCYFVYEEANGLPQQSIRPGTAFADIPANWRCPDCGTEKTTFRPYVEKAATG
jgi:GntR family transcriptional regulator / MocR family aminotransferase